MLVEELKLQLERVGARPPYILVGHSLGGLIARCFALLHRAEVRGLVLVDPANEDQFRQAPMPADFIFGFRILPALFETTAVLAPLGSVRLQSALGINWSFPPSDLLPKKQRDAAIELYSHASPWRLAAAELAGFNAATPFVRSLGEFDPSLPVTIIVASKRDRSPSLHPESITEAFVTLARTVLRGTEASSQRVVLADQSDHWIHLQMPDLVAAEIERLRIATSDNASGRRAGASPLPTSQ